MNFSNHSNAFAAASASSGSSAVSPSRQLSRAECQSWTNRIKEIQKCHVTPEVLSRIREKTERAKNAEKAIRHASRIERCNFVSTVNTCRTLTDFSSASPAFAPSAPAPETAAGEAPRSAMASLGDKVFGFASSSALVPTPTLDESAQLHRVTSNAIQKQAKTMNQKLRTKSAARQQTPITASLPTPEAAHNDSSDEEDDAALDLIEAEILQQCAITTPVLAAATVGSSRGGVSTAAQQSLLSEIDQLLTQLVTEPTEASELAAKFLLFENFLETVTTIRELTLAFWDENQSQFDGAVKAACARDIRQIDQNENLGIIDDSQRWFVYHMTRKANDNSRAISQVLASLKARFALISQELGECPFCLEQLTTDAHTTLGCCHRVCSSCWDHWLTLKGPHAAFCPLCMHTQFVEEIATAADL